MLDATSRAHAFRVSFEKISKELTPESRSDLPGKDFAVSAKQSNTGRPAYPIEDRQHAISALGFSKMHGDSSDAAEVRKDVARKYPDLVKKSGVLGRLATDAAEHKAELAGLGILAAPAVDRMQAQARAHLSGDASRHAIEKRQLMGETGHAATELGGLGILAAPTVAKMLTHRGS